MAGHFRFEREFDRLHRLGTRAQLSDAFDPADGTEWVTGATLFRSDGGTFKVTVYGKDGVPVYCERLDHLNIGIDEEDVPAEN